MANFADLLKKIATNARLTPQELDELGRFGTETQQRNALISGSFQNIETLNVKNIKAVSVEADYVSSIGCRVATNSTQSVATFPATLTVQYGVENYDDDMMVDLSVNNDRININTSGRYLLIGDGFWNSSSTAVKYMAAVLYSSSDVSLGNIALSWELGSSNNIISMPHLIKGQYIKMRGGQYTGGSIDLQYSRLSLTLMRKTDSGDA